MPNQIHDRRNLCSELIRVACADGSGGRRVLTGNLEEIGEWSAVVLVDLPIAGGTHLRIRGEGPEILGLVETCVRAEPLGYFVTLRLDPASRWTTQWFSPDHLLELSGYDDRLNRGTMAKLFPLQIASGY